MTAVITTQVSDTESPTNSRAAAGAGPSCRQDEVVGTPDGVNGTVTAICCGLDSNIIAFGCAEGRLLLFSSSDPPQLIASFDGLGGPVVIVEILLSFSMVAVVVASPLLSPEVESANQSVDSNITALSSGSIAPLLTRRECTSVESPTRAYCYRDVQLLRFESSANQLQRLATIHFPIRPRCAGGVFSCPAVPVPIIFHYPTRNSRPSSEITCSSRPEGVSKSLDTGDECAIVTEIAEAGGAPGETHGSPAPSMGPRTDAERRGTKPPETETVPAAPCCYLQQVQCKSSCSSSANSNPAASARTASGTRRRDHRTSSGAGTASETIVAVKLAPRRAVVLLDSPSADIFVFGLPGLRLLHRIARDTVAASGGVPRAPAQAAQLLYFNGETYRRAAPTASLAAPAALSIHPLVALLALPVVVAAVAYYPNQSRGRPSWPHSCTRGGVAPGAAAQAASLDYGNRGSRSHSTLSTCEALVAEAASLGRFDNNTEIGQLCLVDLHGSVEVVAVTSAHKHPLSSIVVNSAAALVLTASTKGTVYRVWSVPSLQLLWTWRRGIRPATTIAMSFSWDSSYAVILSQPRGGDSLNRSTPGKQQDELNAKSGTKSCTARSCSFKSKQNVESPLSDRVLGLARQLLVKTSTSLFLHAQAAIPTSIIRDRHHDNNGTTDVSLIDAAPAAATETNESSESVEFHSDNNCSLESAKESATPLDASCESPIDASSQAPDETAQTTAFASPVEVSSLIATPSPVSARRLDNKGSGDQSSPPAITVRTTLGENCISLSVHVYVCCKQLPAAQRKLCIPPQLFSQGWQLRFGSDGSPRPSREAVPAGSSVVFWDMTPRLRGAAGATREMVLPSDTPRIRQWLHNATLRATEHLRHTVMQPLSRHFMDAARPAVVQGCLATARVQLPPVRANRSILGADSRTTLLPYIAGLTVRELAAGRSNALQVVLYTPAGLRLNLYVLPPGPIAVNPNPLLQALVKPQCMMLQESETYCLVEQPAPPRSLIESSRPRRK